MMAPLMHSDYKVAWICALPLEIAAAKAMLDKIHQTLPQPTTDPNAYILGDLHGHHIVIACLPTGIYGTISAATIVSHLVTTFTQVQYALMVGIGGGVPSSRNNIRLGDVVVSKPAGKYGGVIQYDYGNTVQGGRFEQTGTLNAPPQVLLTHMAQLQATEMTRSGDVISTIVSDLLERNPDLKKEFAAPAHHTDYLFRSSYHHINPESDCERCDKEQLVYREPRDNATPHVHYGLLASGDQVMKDSETRDSLAQQAGVLCFEMEAAGLMNQLPTLVIRGICDYCDSHKQKQWQGYAALTAAAYARSLLSVVPVGRKDVARTESKKQQHWMVSLARNPNFVGRQNEITKLEELITMQYGPRKIAITGLGGVGKTQVALELAHRIRDRDQKCSVFWIPCTSRAIIEQMFLQIAQMLGLGDVNPAEAKKQVKIHLSSERVGKWLLILDNADDAEMWLTGSHAAPPLEDFLPDSGQGRILFTSRNRKLAMKLAPFNIISIPDEDEDTAAKIYKKHWLMRTCLGIPPHPLFFFKNLPFSH